MPALNFAGKPGTDPSTVLMDILGLQAGSVEFYQRNAYSTDDIRNQANFQKGKKYYDDLSKSFTSKDNLLIFFNSMGLNTASMDPPFTIPQLLRLVYQHYTSTLDAANLIDNVPLQKKSLSVNIRQAKIISNGLLKRLHLIYSKNKILEPVLLRPMHCFTCFCVKLCWSNCTMPAPIG